MVDPSAVTRALRALATGSVRRDQGAGEPAAVVDRAATAFEDVRRAAAFVEDGGLARLRDAAARADTAGDRETARDAQRLLAVVQRFRAVADAPGAMAVAPRALADPTGAWTSGKQSPGDSGPDQLHHARDTVLGGGRQGSRE